MKGSLNVPEYVRDALAGVAQRFAFTNNQHSVDYDFRVFENNRSVVSVLYRVTFREEPREVTVLCKVPPPDADDTMLALFEREVFVYGKLLPALEQFQRTRSEGTASQTSALPSEEDMSASFAPACYHAHCDAKKGEGIIILEDVQRRGFSNRHKFEPMDYDHARLAMVQLGRFHATSLALKKHQPELFEQYRYMGDVTGERVLAMDGFDQAMEQAFESASATLTAGDVARREKLARLRGCFAEELQNISDTALSEPFCVVCHGDYAGDNMMFSYNIKSFDDDTSRVMVEMSIGKERDWLNEHSLQLITMQEYNKNANVINSVKYEQYKDREKTAASTSKSPTPHRSSRKTRHDSDCTASSSDDEREKHRKKPKEVARKDYTHRTSSGTKKKSHKYKQRREHRDDRRDSSRERRHRRARSSDSDASDDKVHKKKTKKKKRPRSRSRSRS